MEKFIIFREGSWEEFGDNWNEKIWWIWKWLNFFVNNWSKKANGISIYLLEYKLNQVEKIHLSQNLLKNH